MLIKHTIFISKLFSEDKRIALHLSSDTKNGIDDESIKKITTELEGYEYSVHTITDSDSTIHTLVDNDAFFKDVVFYDDIDEFKKELDKDAQLTSLDVGRYILARLQDDGIEAYHTKLQKLVYLAYEKYLIDCEDKLFTDQVEAWQYGPVQTNLYQHIKHRTSSPDKGNLKIDSKSGEQSLRILYSKDGYQKLEAIDKVYDKFKRYSSNDLVKYTHREGSAWDITFNRYKSKIIKDETIIDCYIY